MNHPRNTMAVNPPHLTAGLMASSSNAAPRMAARDRAQSWRGKYLRALNICPDKDVPATTTTTNNGKAKLRTMSFHRSDAGDRNSISRSYSSSTEKEDEERKSLERLSQQHQSESPSSHGNHRIQAVPLRIPSRPVTQTMNPYGFVTKPALARGRRCHTDPFLYEERVSAPIQIPTPGAVVNQLDGNMRHTGFSSTGLTSPLSAQRASSGNVNAVPLLSWEEPVAMLAAADAVSRGWKLTTSDNMAMELGRRQERNSGNNQRHTTDRMDEDEDDDDADEDDDEDDHIFAMEGLDEDVTPSNQPSTAKSRRRMRTESLNIVTSGREKRMHHAFDVAVPMDLSKSFVPPHHLVERDCFSIGLRDELRRRPANNI